MDLIVIETFSDLYEIREAIKAAKEVCDLPVVASVTFTRDDRTMLGDDPTKVARTLKEANVDVIGVNCSGGPAQLSRILKQMRQAVPDGQVLGQAERRLARTGRWAHHVSRGRRNTSAITPSPFARWAPASSADAAAQLPSILPRCARRSIPRRRSISLEVAYPASGRDRGDRAGAANPVRAKT